MKLRIGTRGSLLATTQAGTIRDALKDTGYEAELSIVTTPGDVNMSPVERIGVGVFTERLREVLRENGCDVAVHSHKDLPTAATPDLHTVVPERCDAREALIARDGMKLADLPRGAAVGTSAPRRITQLRRLRPDLRIHPLRGNIDTRIAKVTNNELDAVLLAYAGLLRTGKESSATEVFTTEVFLPAPAQGALAVECRTANAATVEALSLLTNAEATTITRAERSLLTALEAGCTAPIGAHATFDSAANTVSLTARVFSIDGAQMIEEHGSAPADQSRELGFDLAQKLLARDAASLVSCGSTTPSR